MGAVARCAGLGAALAVALVSLGGSRPPIAPDRPGPDFDVLDYQVTLEPDFAATSVKGREQITLASLRDGLTEVAFTGNALQVRPDGGQATSVIRRGDDWIVRLKRPLPKGARATLSLRFSGKPARGLVFGPGQIHTDYFACDWMICTQDRPGDKATFGLDLILPFGQWPIITGGITGLRRTSKRSLVHSFRLEQPYSSYLYGFATGPFEGSYIGPENDSPVSVESDSVATFSQRNELLRQTIPMLAFFEARAGVAFPQVSYIELIVPGSAAQESATYSTLGWDGVSAMLADPTEDWLPAHEMAHQWWGNLVTCASWDDFWLNEGITSFMVAAWKQQRWGQGAYDREMTLFRSRVDKARAAGVDVPLTFHGPYPSLGLKRAIVYGKGALFMDALRRQMGETAFWSGLKRYTRTYAGGAADSHDFQRAMQAETPTPLEPLFDSWVY